MSYRLARVVRVHPESRTADVVFIDNGAPRPRVPILGSSGGDTGGFDSPPPEWSGNEFPTGDREMVAVCIGNEHGHYMIVGFLPPPKRQGMFADGRAVNRYHADVYTSVDRDGNCELYHPSGTYLRIGTPGHEDLTGKDVDGSWNIRRNAASTPTITLAGPNFSLSIAPGGGITLTTVGEIGITTPKLTINGDVQVVGGDVKADTVSLKQHVNTGVMPGGANTGPPAQ